METRARSTVKALIWTGIGLIVMTLVGLTFTGSARLGLGMAVLNAGLGFLTYLLYERLWARVPWGRLDA